MLNTVYSVLYSTSYGRYVDITVLYINVHEILQRFFFCLVQSSIIILCTEIVSICMSHNFYSLLLFISMHRTSAYRNFYAWSLPCMPSSLHLVYVTEFSMSSMFTGFIVHNFSLYTELKISFSSKHVLLYSNPQYEYVTDVLFAGN